MCADLPLLGEARLYGAITEAVITAGLLASTVCSTLRVTFPELSAGRPYRYERQVLV